MSSIIDKITNLVAGEGEQPAKKAPADEVFVGSIDQGTTSSRFLIFDKAGEPVAVHQEEFRQIYPNPGWHEHDPEEIVKSVENCIEGALKIFEKDGHSKDSIKAIGITDQRETTVVWDKTTGEALYNAIVWTDTRTAALARELKSRSGSDKLQDICGLPISTYPSVTKLLWLLRNQEKVRKVYEAGNLAFGTIDAWLIYKLNGGPEKNVFVSDPTNASRTMFMDIRTLKYNDEMLDFFSYEYDLRKVHMPEIVRSSDTKAFGQLASGSLKGFPITGCLGDQSAALVGQKGFEPGSAKNTYGTGCFLLYNVGDKPVISTHGLLATVAYDFDGKPVYALEGSIAVAGSGVKFLMHNLGFSHASHHITELAETVKDNGGLVFVTAFSGLFAPYWIDDAHGTMFGITHHTERGHIARATLEAVCFQTKAILDAMEKDSGHKLAELKVDGGMSNSALCMQTQADLVSIPIVRPQMRETTALGAAIAAGFAVGVWKDFDELKEVNTKGQTVFEPKMEAKESKRMLKKWERAVAMCKGWLAEEEEEEGKTEEAAELKESAAKDEAQAEKVEGGKTEAAAEQSSGSASKETTEVGKVEEKKEDAAAESKESANNDEAGVDKAEDAKKEDGAEPSKESANTDTADTGKADEGKKEADAAEPLKESDEKDIAELDTQHTAEENKGEERQTEQVAEPKEDANEEPAEGGQVEGGSKADSAEPLKESTDKDIPELHTSESAAKNEAETDKDAAAQSSESASKETTDVKEEDSAQAEGASKADSAEPLKESTDKDLAELDTSHTAEAGESKEAEVEKAEEGKKENAAEPLKKSTDEDLAELDTSHTAEAGESKQPEVEKAEEGKKEDAAEGEKKGDAAEPLKKSTDEDIAELDTSHTAEAGESTTQDRADAGTEKVEGVKTEEAAEPLKKSTAEDLAELHTAGTNAEDAEAEAKDGAPKNTGGEEKVEEKSS